MFFLLFKINLYKRKNNNIIIKETKINIEKIIKKEISKRHKNKKKIILQTQILL